MFHNPDRQAMRKTFSSAWSLAKRGAPASDLERQIAAVVAWHPEYHRLVEDAAALERDFMPDDGQTNPFLHMGLHLAVRDQLATDRPAGIRALFARLREACADEHGAEHVLLERLGETLWRAQRDGQAPDEAAYLANLREDLRRLSRHGSEGL